MGGKNLNWTFEKIPQRLYIHILTITQSKKGNTWSAMITYSSEGIWGIPYKDGFLNRKATEVMEAQLKNIQKSLWLSRLSWTQPYTFEIKILFRFQRLLWLLEGTNQKHTFPRRRHCDLGITGTHNSAVRITGILLRWGALEPLQGFTYSHLLFQRAELKNWVGPLVKAWVCLRSFAKRIWRLWPHTWSTNVENRSSSVWL